MIDRHRACVDHRKEQQADVAFLCGFFTLLRIGYCQVKRKAWPAAQNGGSPWPISVPSRPLGPNVDVERRPTFPLSGCRIRYLESTRNSSSRCIVPAEFLTVSRQPARLNQVIETPRGGQIYQFVMRSFKRVHELSHVAGEMNQEN